MSRGLGLGYIGPGLMGLADAPVSGGKAEHIERVRPVVMQLAQRFTRMGDAGVDANMLAGSASAKQPLRAP